MNRLSEWRETVEQLYRQHSQMLYWRAMRSLSDKNKAADLVQQVFARLLETNPRIDSFQEAEKYLNKSFTHLLIDHARTEITWKRQSLEDVKQEEVSKPPSQEEALIRERMEGKKLPLASRERWIFEKAYFRGMSDRDIAEEMQLNIYTVQRSLLNSRKALEKILIRKHNYTKKRIKELFSRKKQ